VRGWDAARVADAAGAELVRDPPAGAAGPAGVTVDSRAADGGKLFVGIPGQHHDGGSFIPDALAAGAWGALATPARIAEAAAGALLAKSGGAADIGGPGALMAADDPVAALGRLARAWRRELGCRVIGITGSTGKTSTKDIIAAMLAPHVATVASPENLNTEIGVPLAILRAPEGTAALVLEMAMRGPGQIAELAAIAEPDVGVIVNIGPVHLEKLGSVQAIAAAKAELIRDLPAGATAVVPAGEPLLEPHWRQDIEFVTFGEGGSVRIAGVDGGRLLVDAGGEQIALELPFAQPFQQLNALAAAAAARAIGVTPGGTIDVRLSALRGERLDLPGGIAVINDCYNANPMSMRAALADLELATGGRRVAVLGDMLELGPAERSYHQEIGAVAHDRGVDVLVTVGPLAAEMAAAFGGEAHRTATAAEAAELVAGIAEAGDTILVKGSRGVRLEAVAAQLAEQLGG
jgi:UDP-N-acetylmuramoyl-tripeptide--D-alanyl-D-alanine ligase